MTLGWKILDFLDHAVKIILRLLGILHGRESMDGGDDASTLFPTIIALPFPLGLQDRCYHYRGHRTARIRASSRRSRLSWTDCSISVLSRNPNHLCIACVSCHTCDVTEIECLRILILQIQPQSIFLTASPQFYEDIANENLLHEINIVGIRNLLDDAKLIESVKAFVYKSSSSVHGGFNFRFITEEAPLLNQFPEQTSTRLRKLLQIRWFWKPIVISFERFACGLQSSMGKGIAS